MLKQGMFKICYNKARWSGIRIVPAKAPSLYQECVRVFVAEVNRSSQNGKRISELQFLPTAALVNIFEEMCQYPALREKLRVELADPVLFMRLFTQNRYRLVLDRCIREASLSGKPVMNDLAKNYCDMVGKEIRAGEQFSEHRISSGLKLGNYLYEGGWLMSSALVLDVVAIMISLLKEDETRKKLELDCFQQLLRVEGLFEFDHSAETCETLKSLVADVTDSDILVRTYLVIARYYHNTDRHDQCHEWTLKAFHLIKDSTPVDDVIEVLQLKALYCISKKRFDLGNMLISQAIQRARNHYGSLHRRYADVLQTYGRCLMDMEAVSDAVSIFMEQLDVITRLYGDNSPHAPAIMGFLAYGFYIRSHSTGRFDMALDQIDKAIALSKQLELQCHTIGHHELREMIVQGRDPKLNGFKESQPIKAHKYESFSFPEIREKYLELHSSFDTVCC
ncbi:amyloid protein-binding protein 2-like [Uranotaenia lowii]|uniref:amyloid protein-binding protein 2-like n=1 Tax=Uranotaenia lowii TaxID=190385 RepID=UPI00247945F7|nr:amyloid protein-binding protein 2-like [Uranotaenia lowii]